MLFDTTWRHRFSVAFCISALAGPGLADEERSNAFNDPFVQVTSRIAGCPVPEGPAYTAQEVRDVAPVRAQHGGSCYRAGRCRLPNSYLYDLELIARVQKYIEQTDVLPTPAFGWWVNAGW